MNTARIQQERSSPLFFFDTYLLSTVIVLVLFSLVMIYSTTAIISAEKFGDSFLFLRKQGIALVIGIFLMFVCATLSLETLTKLSKYTIYIALLMLILVLVPGIGHIAGGARRWIILGPIRFQPGEFVKVLMVISLAGYLARNESKVHGFVHGIIFPAVMIGSAAVLYLAQPDFGSVVVLTAVSFAMLLGVGARIKFFLGGLLTALIAASVLIIVSPYRLQRILTFLAPWEDAQGKGYQLIQSLIAVGTGKVTGTGLGASQQKLFFLPAAHTDFIFAVIAEELGFFGCVGIIILFMVFLWRGIIIAGRVADDTFAFALALGCTFLIVAPALLNIGVVIGLLPTKGMVLPLVGYGGSSLMASLAAVGMMLAVSKTVNKRNY